MHTIFLEIRKGVCVMRGGLMTGMAAGMLIGATATIMMMPQLDHRTRRRVNKIGRRMTNSILTLMDTMRG